MKIKESKTDKVLSQNVHMYKDYYQKPDWWFRFRYDTQVKRKTCLHLLKQARCSLASQRVLEIGFGSGAVLFSFDPSCEIYGIEISHSAITQAKQKATKLDYKRADFGFMDQENLPYPNEHFDIIVASHVVEHTTDDRKLLTEMRRVLRPQGTAVILVPINEVYNDPNHLHRYNSLEFVELAKDCSLSVIYTLENELLFHVVEKFYFEEYNYRWKILGPLVAALFNFTTSVLPFWAYQMIDRIMMALGWKPRQLGCIFARSALPDQK